MSKTISSEGISPTLTLSECTDGFWLYDDTRGMNLAVRAKTKTEAFVKALSYYQDRLGRVEKNYQELKQKVDLFVEQFTEEEEG